jgi:hypothetical protein
VYAVAKAIVHLAKLPLEISLEAVSISSDQRVEFASATVLLKQMIRGIVWCEEKTRVGMSKVRY